MRLGQKIRLLREKRFVSQIRLAKIIGIHPSSLGQIEAGRHLPSAEVIKALETHLETNFEKSIMTESKCPVMRFGIK